MSQSGDQGPSSGRPTRTRVPSKKRSYERVSNGIAPSPPPKRRSVGANDDALRQVEKERLALTNSIVISLPTEVMEEILIAAALRDPIIMSQIINANSYNQRQRSVNATPEVHKQEVEQYARSASDVDDEEEEEEEEDDEEDDDDERTMDETTPEIVLPAQPPKRKYTKRNSKGQEWMSSLNAFRVPAGRLPPTSGLIPVGVLKKHTNVVRAGFDHRMRFNWRVTKYNRVGEQVESLPAPTKREFVELHPTLDSLTEDAFYSEVLRRQWENE